MIKNIIKRFKSDYYLSVIMGYVYVFTNMVSSFFLIPLYLRFLGLYDYGVFMIIFSFANYIAIGIGFMSGGALRLLTEAFSAKDAKGVTAVYSTSKLVFLVYGIFAAIAFVFYILCIKGAAFITNGDPNAKLIKILVYTSLFLIARYSNSVEFQRLTANKKQFVSNFFQTLAQVLYIAGAIPVLYNGGGIAELLLCYFLSNVIVRISIFYYNKVHDAYKTAIEFDMPNMSVVFKRLTGSMGAGYFIYGIIAVTLPSDILILGTIGGARGAEIAAAFSIVWKVAEAGILLLNRIPGSMVPYVMGMDSLSQTQKIKNTYKKADRIMLILSAAAAIGFALLGKPFIHLWLRLGGNTTIPDIDNWLIWLAAGAVFWLGISHLPCIFAYSTLRLKWLNIVAGTELILKILLITLLFNRFQALSSVLAINVIHICGMAVAYRILGKKSIEAKGTD